MAKAKRKAATRLSFGEAMGEVEEILDRLEEDTVDIDDLAVEVRRAVELIKLCRGKLDRTDREVRELVAELEEDAAAAEPPAEAREANAEADADANTDAEPPGRVGRRKSRAGDTDADDLPF